MTAKGPYAKGIAKREEILTTALGVIARNGYRRTSVRELADAVGLSQAGLLHYFTSKEELFTEVLRKRDEVDRETYIDGTEDPLEAFVGVIRHNADVPGLVQLYSRLAVDATDAEHAAHDFFVERFAGDRTEITAAIAAEQKAGRIDAGLDPERLASVILAAADGLQTQWLLDPSIDMAAHLSELWRALTSGAAR